ncbi:LCP family protein [Nocardia bovistercoris]|uniref:LCP family protein n=1 Tax=Nocardia bovistercoris TaxID=2785916 RepID=A0A931IHQ6_9NOCA|nr:LCP family protein [Nocardia bovistercoris]
MGDDRHGQSPRPGGRAPWERIPPADPAEREGSRASRRARHDAPEESGAAPLTVQELVEKVDNERTGRRRRAEPSAPAPESAPPRAEALSRAPESASRPSGRSAPESAPRPPGAGAQEAARPPRPARAPGAAPPPAGKPARRGGPSRPNTGSVVVDDIAGKAPPANPRPVPRPTPMEPAEAVTDIITPVTEKDAEPEGAKPKAKTRPARSATPESVGKPLSRLAAGRQRRNRKLKTGGRVAAAAFAVLILLITGGGWSYQRSTDNRFTQVSAFDDNPEDVIDSDAQLGDENYLLVGTDTRDGANGELGAGTLEDAEGTRADTTMLVHIPKARNRVVVVSFPRDLDVTRPQCTGWNNDNRNPAYTKESYPSAMGDKLNATYALGGPKCLVTTIQRLTGSSINHFIAIDFAGFEAMVNQIGGVEVCAAKPIIDDTLGTVLAQAGKQRVDGATALNYVRARHVYGEERSDYDRISRQQRFLSSLLRGAMSSRVLFDPGKLNGFVQAFANHTMVGNVTSNDLLMLGRSLQKVDAGAVTFITVPTAGTTTYGNEIPRDSDIKAIFKAIRDDQPLPGEKPSGKSDAPAAPPAAPAPKQYRAVSPASVSLLVSNGSGYEGLARTAANKLSAQGFTIYNTGNYANGTSPTTKVRYGTGLDAEAATVATAIPGASIESADDLGGIVEIVIGADSTSGVTVRAPTPVGEVITNVSTAATDAAPPVLPSDLEHINAADEICK